jgi:hypothetical protein
MLKIVESGLNRALSGADEDWPKCGEMPNVDRVADHLDPKSPDSSRLTKTSRASPRLSLDQASLPRVFERALSDCDTIHHRLFLALRH